MNKNLLIGVGIFGLVIVYFVFFNRPATTPEITDTETTEMMEDESMMAKSMMLNLAEQNDSGEMGTISLVETNGQVMVTLTTQGAPEEVPQPAHIHTGSCPDVGGVAYPLTNVVNGESETLLDVTMEQLESEMPLAINVHKSVPEASVYTACGDLEF